MKLAENGMRILTKDTAMFLSRSLSCYRREKERAMESSKKIIKGKNWEAVRLNPMDFIRRNLTEEKFEKVQTYVTFNPDADFQYKRRQQSAHDGTRLFELELLADTVNPILTMDSFYKPSMPTGLTGFCRVEYEIGWLWILSVFGTVDIPAGRFPGMKQRTFMRVRSKFVASELEAA